MDTRIPKRPEIVPFKISLEDMVTMMLRAKKVREKYSKAPNFRATLARRGAMRIRAAILMAPPKNDEKIPSPSAFPAWPWDARPDRS